MVKYENDDMLAQILFIIIVLVIGNLVFTRLNLPKITYILLYTLLAYYLVRLELRYSDNLEKGNHDTLRINTERFKENPHRELYRYLHDTRYYNNIWRISALCAIIICLFITLEVPVFPLLFIVVFTVIYHCWGWKLHHTYNFIFKSVQEACLHLETKKEKPFHQEMVIKLESLSNLKM
jgi:hypothetical protein